MTKVDTQTSSATGGNGSLGDEFSRDDRLYSEGIMGSETLNGIHALDVRLEKEVSFIKERAGYTSGGIPTSGGRMGQLGAEDFGWNRVGGESNYDAYTNRVYMSSYLAHKFHNDPIARNIVASYTFFTFGGGFQISFEDENRQAEFEGWSDEREFVNFQRKLLQEQFLFGNAPVVMYPLTWENPPENIDELPGIIPEVRPTEAQEYRYLPDSRLKRVHRSESDYEKVLAYEFDGIGLVAPCDVVSFQVDPIGTGSRGASVLTPVLVDLVQIQKFAEARFYLNLTRSRLPVIRKVHNSTAGKNALTSLPQAGRVLRIGHGEDIVFPSLNVDGSGVYDDYRMLMLRIASGVSLPEYLVGQDASNGNYASALVAESPAHNLFRSFQRVFSRRLKRLLTELGWADATIEPPSVVPRNMKNEALAMKIALDARLVSRQTASEKLGFDWQTEMTRFDANIPGELFPDIPANGDLLDEPDSDGDDTLDLAPSQQ